jgi:hypothetical protein
MQTKKPINEKSINKKEALLKEIEALLTYNPENKTTINPDYLEYLEIEDLENIKKGLMERVGELTPEDIEWLEQFKRYG